jgi:hypothetical protein
MGLAADKPVAEACSTSGRELPADSLLALQERLRGLPFLVKVRAAAAAPAHCVHSCGPSAAPPIKPPPPACSARRNSSPGAPPAAWQRHAWHRWSA